jgi:Na+/H+ antiporter
LGIHGVELILLLLVILVVALAALAKRLDIPYPIIMVIGGLIISFLPHVPAVPLNPDMIFLVILPPLLFSSAYVTSWRAFRFNLASISMMAFGLVGFTVFGVAAAAKWLLPGFSWRSGLVLGAVVSTTDAIAATSIAQKLGLPKRITEVLEGESLVNDASGLLALEYATALLVSGSSPGIWKGTLQLLWLVVGSIAIGLLAGKVVRLFETRIEDASIEITMTLIAPYFAYLAGESAHASGVLATVVCGMYLGHESSMYFSTGARLTGDAVWKTLTFILNGFVFILIGFQLPHILPAVSAERLGRMIWYGLLLSVVLILLRLIWVYPGAELAYQIRKRYLHHKEPRANPKAIFIVGWTGMRGVVCLAAAIALPNALANGRPFPHREVMIFLTFCVIFVTLVLQGLTLPTLIRRLGLAGAGGKEADEQLARRAMIDAALAYLEHSKEDDPGSETVYKEMIGFHRRRRSLLETSDGDDGRASEENRERYRELLTRVRGVQRATILHMRNLGEIDDEVMRRLERELDLTEVRYSSGAL